MSFTRRQFLLSTVGAAGGFILPSFYARALEFVDQFEEPLLEPPKRVVDELIICSELDGELNLGDPWEQPPEGSDAETWTGVVDVPFTEEDIKGLALRAKDAGKGLWKKQFEPTPVPKMCKLCDYESCCDARQAQRAANARKRKKPDILPQDVTGAVDLGFGGSLSVAPAVDEVTEDKHAEDN